MNGTIMEQYGKKTKENLPLKLLQSLFNLFLFSKLFKKGDWNIYYVIMKIKVMIISLKNKNLDIINYNSLFFEKYL